jgi:hypothetical protein
MGNVVLIHAGEVPTPCHIYGLVQSGCQAKVPAVLNDANAGIQDVRHGIHRPIGGAVVNQQQFPV